MFFSFFRPHLGLFALDMSCAIAVAVIDLAFPYITRVSMQTLLPEKLYTTFFVIMAAMFAAYILKGVLYYLITVLGHKMGVYIEADMRHAVFNHMQKLSFSFFDHNRTGVLMSRITSDLFEITELAHHGRRTSSSASSPSSARSSCSRASSGASRWCWPSACRCSSCSRYPAGSA